MTPNGVRVTVNGLPYLFWDPASEACAAADQVTGSKKKFTALVNEDDLSEIFLLDGEGRFVEALPQDEKAGANNPAELRKAYAESRTGHDRAQVELARITRGDVRARTDQLDDEARKMRGVVSTTVGNPDAAGVVSYTLKRTKYPAARPAPRSRSSSRHHAAPADIAAFAASLGQSTEEA